MVGAGRLVTCLAAAGLAGCKLTEDVPAPVTDPVVIVHAILNTASPRQRVLVERSRIGGRTPGISGATVRLTHLNPGGCPSPSVVLGEVITTTAFEGDSTGTYETTGLCPLLPGDEVELRVETPTGELVTGTTTIPGAAGISLMVAGQTYAVSGAAIPMDRTRDTLRAALEAPLARAIEVEIGVPYLGFRQKLSIQSDSMHLTLPGNLFNPFDEEQVFDAGTFSQVTVSAIDRNYYDFARSGSDPFTGQGFLNHLTGGVGVFGSVHPVTFMVRVSGPQREPWEGRYRMTGVLAGSDVDFTLDVYRDPGSGPFGDAHFFWALVEGTFVEGPVEISAYGGVEGRALQMTIWGSPRVPGDPSSALSFQFGGELVTDGSPFDVDVLWSDLGDIRTATLTAVRVSGP